MPEPPNPNALYQAAVRRDLERLHPRIVSVMVTRLLGKTVARKRLDHEALLAGYTAADFLPVLAHVMGDTFPEREYRQLVSDRGHQWPEPWLERVAEVAAWPEWRPLQRLGILPAPPGKPRYRSPATGKGRHFRVRRGPLLPAHPEVAVTAEHSERRQSLRLPWQGRPDALQQQLLSTYTERGEAALASPPSAAAIPGVEVTPVFTACRLDVVAEDRAHARDYLVRYNAVLGFGNDSSVLAAWQATTTPVWYHLPAAIGVVTQLAEWTGYPPSTLATMLYTTGFQTALVILPDMARLAELDTPEALRELGMPRLIRQNVTAPDELVRLVHWQLQLERWRKGQPRQVNLSWAKLGERIVWRVPKPLARAVTRTAKAMSLPTPALSNLYLDIGLYLYTHRIIPYPALFPAARQRGLPRNVRRLPRRD